MIGFEIQQLLQSWPLFMRGLGMTAGLSALAIVGGTLFGFALGIARAAGPRFLDYAIGIWVDIIRGTPFLAQVFIIFFILPELGIELDAFTAGLIAMVNLAACFICEIVRAGISSVPVGQTEGSFAVGLTRMQALRLVVLPQAMRLVLPPLVSQYVLLIKDSSVVSVIGLTDLTRAGWIAYQNIPNGLLVFGIVGVGYFLVCQPLILLAQRLERRMRGEEPEILL